MFGTIPSMVARCDARRSSRFFAAALGWKPLDRPGNIAVPAAWLEIAPGQELHLVEVPEYQSTPFDREYGRHIAITRKRNRTLKNGY